jgi:hypothetical protein
LTALPSGSCLQNVTEPINSRLRPAQHHGAAVVNVLTVPTAWVTHVSELLATDGLPLDRDRFDACLRSTSRSAAR